MKQAIGQSQIINFVMIFIAITFAFLIATLGYMKAFKVNSRIASHLEKYEGYNNYAKNAIQRDLNSIGYQKGTANCGEDGEAFEGYKVCIKSIIVGNKEKPSAGEYVRYRITTYIKFGPILGASFEIPIRSQSEKIYVFKESVN